MRIIVLFIWIILAYSGFAQKTTLYLFPWQGADSRLFDSLKIDTSNNLNIIAYGTLSKELSLSELAA